MTYLPGSKPRVLIVSHTYAAAINHAKLEALAQHVTLTAITTRQWRDALFELEAEPASAAYTLHRLPVHFSGHIMRHFYSFSAIRAILSQVRPDLVYVEEEPASLVLAQFAWFKRYRGYRLVCFTWENLRLRLGPPGLERLNLAQCDGVVAGNQDAARRIAATGFRRLVTVTPQLGVDPTRFRPDREPRRREALGLEGFVAGYIGRLVAEKGLETLCEAALALPNVNLLFVGAGPWWAELERRLNTPLGARLRVIEAVSHDAVPAILNTLDVLALPSRTTPFWKEQFGHVLIEAMACGVPVIGSDSGAIPEVIGSAGIIVPEGNREALGAALKRLRDDLGLREQLGQAGRERALAHFTHERVAAANAAFFQQALSQ